MTAPHDAVAACCANLYGHPLAEMLVGRSLHPGGLTATRALLDAAHLAPGDRLLDVGCGLGESARVAASAFGLRVDAVDASGSIVERASSRAGGTRVRWTVAALPDLPFEDASFDAVLAECVLSTVDRPAALAEIARVLRPGGTVLLSDVETDGSPSAGLEHRVVGAALCVTDAWRPGEIDRTFAAAGLHITQRWDRSESIIELVDRIEARLSVVDLAARDLGLDLSTLLGASRWTSAPMTCGPSRATLSMAFGRRSARVPCATRR